MKITKTYSIEEGTYNLFEETCKRNNINKSAFLEGCVKNYLKQNIGYDDQELYFSRNNRNYLVSIIDQDDTFFTLSDGSKVPQILFYQTFVKVEKVDPDKFFTTKNKLNEIAEQLNNDKNEKAPDEKQ